MGMTMIEAITEVLTFFTKQVKCGLIDRDTEIRTIAFHGGNGRFPGIWIDALFKVEWGIRGDFSPTDREPYYVKVVWCDYRYCIVSFVSAESVTA